MSTTKIVNYDSTTGTLTIIKPYGFKDCSNDSYDACYTGSVTIYLVENIEN